MVLIKNISDVYHTNLNTLVSNYSEAESIWAGLLEESLSHRSNEVTLTIYLPHQILLLAPTLTRLSEEEVRKILQTRGFRSAVGRRPLARVLSFRLQEKVDYQYQGFNPKYGETYIVALVNPRNLPKDRDWTKEDNILGLEINYLKVDF